LFGTLVGVVFVAFVYERAPSTNMFVATNGVGACVLQYVLWFYFVAT
jgi:hypothetical protein